MGRSVVRDVRAVLLHMLLQATPENFDVRAYEQHVATAAGGDGGSNASGGSQGPRVYSDFFSTPACAMVETDTKNVVGSIAAATKLLPTLLALATSSDVTNIEIGRAHV